MFATNTLCHRIEYLAFDKLKLTPHVAGCTILACASSSSELIASLVGVLVAKNDLSINSNLLMITRICCFCVYKIEVNLNKYPIRDCFFYFLNLILLFFCCSKTISVDYIGTTV